MKVQSTEKKPLVTKEYKVLLNFQLFMTEVAKKKTFMKDFAISDCKFAILFNQHFCYLWKFRNENLELLSTVWMTFFS